MEHEMVSLADFARELELTKSATRKAIKTLEAKSRRKFMNKGRVEGNQRGYVLTREAANEVLALRKQEGFTVGSTASAIVASASMPNVYVLDLTSGRMKIGYTDTFDQRLRSHRTVAPDLTVLRRWELPQAYETVMCDIAEHTEGMRKLSPEVFEEKIEGSRENVLTRLDALANAFEATNQIV